jgi:hypothetical protein
MTHSQQAKTDSSNVVVVAAVVGVWLRLKTLCLKATRSTLGLTSPAERCFVVVVVVCGGSGRGCGGGGSGRVVVVVVAAAAAAATVVVVVVVVASQISDGCWLGVAAVVLMLRLVLVAVVLVVVLAAVLLVAVVMAEVVGYERRTKKMGTGGRRHGRNRRGGSWARGGAACPL